MRSRGGCRAASQLRSPTAHTQVSLLNFLVTPEGLEEQLLGTTVTQERPDLANMKTQLVLSNARMKKELKDIEDKILVMLSNSQVCTSHAHAALDRGPPTPPYLPHGTRHPPCACSEASKV
jgi:hypothetical protein